MKLRLLFLLFAFLFIAPSAHAATPPACSMSLTPWSITKGGSITLKWSSSNATAAVIPGPGLGNVETNGQRNLIPIRSTRYVGTFTGAGGKATCEAVVTVILPDGGATVLLDADDPLYFDEPDEVVAPNTFNKPAPLPDTPGLAPAPTIQPGAPIQLSNKAGKGLLPCTGINCQMCHLATLAQNIINFLIGLSIPLAAALFAYAGFIYFSSSVVDKIAKARKIFTSVLIGFGLVAGGWLIVQTILSTILSAQYKNWNQIQCIQSPDNTLGGRQYNKDIKDLLSTISILNKLNTSGQPPVVVGGGVGVNTPSSSYDLSTGCRVGGYLQDNGTCMDAFGTAYPPINTATANSDIADAALNFKGANTNTGPDTDYGNKACAWAVNQVLQNDGISPIDGNSVADMEQLLATSRGTPSGDTATGNLSNVGKGDIVVWKDYENGTYSHVGICLDSRCSQVISNSSGDKNFSTITNINFNSNWQARIYHVNR